MIWVMVLGRSLVGPRGLRHCFGDGSTSISFKYISSFVSPRTPYTSANRYALYLLELCLVSLEQMVKETRQRQK